MLEASQRTSEYLWRAYSYAPLRLAHSSDCGEALLLPGGLLAMAAKPDPDLNWGFVYGPDDPSAALTAFVARLRERGLPGHLVASDELADQLSPTARRLGLKAVGEIPLLLNDGKACSPPHAPAQSLHAGRVVDPATLAAAYPTLAAAFPVSGVDLSTVYRPVLLDMPGLHLFVAWDGDDLAAYAATVDEGEIVWFFDVGTHPDHRHKGAATCVLLQAMDWWRDRGHSTFGLGAEAEAQHLYESLGFTQAASSTVWLEERRATP